MSDVVKGSNFVIVPSVDKSAMNKAEQEIFNLVQKASKAAEEGNEKVLQNVASKLAKKTGQAQPEVTVKVSYETDSATGSIKQIRTLSAGALDPMLKDFKKMVGVQGEQALKVKQEIALQKDKLASLRQQASTLDKKSRAYKRNLNAQKDIVATTKRYEELLKKVTSLASLKGQHREASQLLSTMHEHNIVLNKQGKLVAAINPEWVAQNKTVQGLKAQVKTAEASTKSFGAKVALAGKTMQNAFGWIGALVAGLTTVAGAVGVITNRAKDIQALKLTFDGLGQSVEAQNAILGRSKNIALSYGVSLRKVEGAFKRLGPAILESGGSLQDTDKAIQSIAARTTMLGLNTEQSGRYIEAFAQVMGKGKLQSEELNQQFSELDGGLRGQLKNWLRVNKGISDFEGAMKKGEITSGMFLEAFDAINEEIRTKFLRSIGDTQTAIDSLGQKGGLTLNQLNAQLQTLSSISFEAMGEALAPLGKEIMKIYAAFVQVFTKIATEMPGIQEAFKFLGHILGVVLKVSINTVLLLIHDLSVAIDQVAQFVARVYNAAKNVPGLGHILEGMEGMAQGLNRNFDEMVDNTARLSDETIGATSSLEKYASKTEELQRMKESGQISEEEYHKKMREIEASRTQERIDQLQSQFEQETANRKIVADQAKADYEEQLSQAKALHDEKIKTIDAEIAALRAKTPTEQKLYDLRKKELQDAIKKGGLNEKELLTKTAQLERMQRQEKINALIAEKDKEKKRFAEEQKTLQEEMNTKIQRQDDLLAGMKGNLEAIRKHAESQATAGENFEAALEGVTQSTGEAAVNTERTQTAASQLEGSYGSAATQAGNMASNIQNAAAAQRSLNAAIAAQPKASSSSPNKASGGPVVGGKSYTVNELGVEGFMSSSGKLSEIKAPSWGSWKAPSTGTVIPAHVWKSVKAAQASTVSMPKTVNPGNQMANMISSISNRGGDQFNNSVTIQAANPVQAANNVMVEMTRMRRRRMG